MDNLLTNCLVELLLSCPNTGTLRQLRKTFYVSAKWGLKFNTQVSCPSYQHFCNICHRAFTLQEDDEMVAARRLSDERPMYETMSQHLSAQNHWKYFTICSSNFQLNHVSLKVTKYLLPKPNQTATDNCTHRK